MPAIAPVVINDGKATPEAHTFDPVKSSPACVWREKVTDVPLAGQGMITLTQAQNKGDLYKTRVTLTIPVMEESSGPNSSGYTAAPKVAHSVRADLVLFAHGRSTPEQRKDLITLLRNALSDAMIEDSFVESTKPW